MPPPAENGSFDVVLCGGGTAGSVVAARLVDAGRKVLLLEAGPDYGAFQDGRWPPELLDSATIPTSHDWGYRSGDGRLPFERAKVVGGSSAHNGCTASWGHRADYDGWGLPGWSADELLPLFKEASRRLRVRRFEEDEWAPLHRGFIEAGIELGLPFEDRLESLDARPAVCAEPSNSPDGVRWNAAFAYLDPVRGRPTLEVRGETLIDRVVVANGRAVGVRAVGPDGPFEVGADLVVLAGGTYGSPAILLRSGLGPTDQLHELGIPTVEDLPGVGANLHDHPAYELVFSPSEELERRTAAFVATGRAVPDEQGFASMASSLAADGLIDLHVFSEVAMDGRLGIFVAGLTPESRGRLTLRSADPDASPILDHGFLTDVAGHDLAVLVEGMERARDFAATRAMGPLIDGELEPGAGADLAGAIRQGVIHNWHPVGTCAMGVVTDERGRLKGVDGVVVADASLMPRTVRATTNLPTVVIAERVARFLTE
jgi:choline dehydrogenase